ncbi:uncharacterized protein PAC_11653 [Phialocephala subalpina]|uniref:Aminoglycoside phosphotransferase domain-containing protein n=1 Tax=Phialocephala subalpina TaxID=576137 RepID=A0A1L7X9T7_9HELO|nr:uncharacterized protein PAC_11653 [Phialocephala subalpina]
MGDDSAKSGDLAKCNDLTNSDSHVDHDYRHPEREQKDLIWAPDEKSPAGYKKLRAEQGRPPVEETWMDEHRELCWACGWTNYLELHSSYSPRLKIYHARQNMGLWDVGGQWVLRDEPNDGSAGNDFMTQQFLRAQPGLTIPLVAKMLALSGPDDAVQFTLMSQASGVRLDQVWPRLSPAQKAGYVRQMAAVITALRQFTAPSAQKVDGSLLDDLIIGHCVRRRAPSCTKIGPTADAWIDALAPSLRGGLSHLHKTNDPAIIDAKLAELRANFPPGGPYYLTHGDLNLSNIIVQDDKITAILDWEMAGYYPWWAERWLSIRNYAPANELFDPMWALLEPELSFETLRRDVSVPVGDVISAWEKCNVEHPGQNARWLRPAFSKCEPWAGEIKWRDCGNQLEHKIRDVQWGAESPNYPYNGLYSS